MHTGSTLFIGFKKLFSEHYLENCWYTNDSKIILTAVKDEEHFFFNFFLPLLIPSMFDLQTTGFRQNSLNYGM